MRLPKYDPRCNNSLQESRAAMRDFLYHASRCTDPTDRAYSMRMVDEMRRKVERLTCVPEPMPEVEPRYIGVHMHAGGQWYWEHVTQNGRRRVRRHGFSTARAAAIARERYFNECGITNVTRNQIEQPSTGVCDLHPVLEAA